MAKLIRKDPIHIELKDLRKGFTVEPGYSYTFVLKKHEVQIDIIEAEDVLFRTDSALFLPFALPKDDEQQDDSVFESQDDPMDKQIRVSGLSVIGGLFRYYQLCLDRGQAKHILITGHTDTAGKESHNEKLSLKRANVVSYIILGDKKSRSMFVINVNKQHTNEDKQHVLLWLAKVLGVPEAHPGKIDGKMGRTSNSAIRAIKKYLRSDNFPPCNYKEAAFGDDIDDIRATLQNNTKFDANLWAIVFEIYQAELQVSLKQDNYDIFSIRESLKWVDNKKKAVGCGETWSIDARGKKNYRSRSNRRAEILFYDPDEIKDEIPCKENKCAEDDCHIFKNMNRYNPKPIEKHLKWEYVPLTDTGEPLKPEICEWIVGLSNCDISTAKLVVSDTNGKELSRQDIPNACSHDGFYTIQLPRHRDEILAIISDGRRQLTPPLYVNFKKCFDVYSKDDFEEFDTGIRYELETGDLSKPLPDYEDDDEDSDEDENEDSDEGENKNSNEDKNEDSDTIDCGEKYSDDIYSLFETSQLENK